MHSELKEKRARARRRALRVRRRLRLGRPRLSVFRSLRHIYAQVIDDARGHTLAAADTVVAVRRGELRTGGNIEAARWVGRLIAARAREAGVEEVVFDRGPYRYHGRVKALAEAAREGGLRF